MFVKNKQGEGRTFVKIIVGQTYLVWQIYDLCVWLDKVRKNYFNDYYRNKDVSYLNMCKACVSLKCTLLSSTAIPCIIQQNDEYVKFMEV